MQEALRPSFTEELPGMTEPAPRGKIGRGKSVNLRQSPSLDRLAACGRCPSGKQEAVGTVLSRNKHSAAKMEKNIN